MSTDRADLAEVFKALSNPARLEILNWLREPDKNFAEWEPIADRAEFGVCVTHIQAKSGLAQSTTSAAMALLERAGLVRSARVGKYRHYRRDEERIAGFVAALGRDL
ncbi:helix-turn-helix domain-containing protein [Kineosporia rhizophila]|uniref:ArsR/SmtB family transcription factor n=1 Tax=Kineosporia TaxID=49184 RepID=UPI001E2D8BBB|nr:MULTISPECIES: metalloregulator ArsR/SmtB family transcription factor [Kineosporia]MCE0536364.1 helix-turn-helix domain-containing protein [Kineosporia rhizophila]GLY19839.1 transcriptional regulator [Kineosporia sp. NBRC 101677]